MSIKNLRYGCCIALAAYIALAVLFWWICGEQLRYREETSGMATPSEEVGELVQGRELLQPLTAAADELHSVTLYFSTYERTNTSQLMIELRDAAGTALTQVRLTAAGLPDNAAREIVFPEPAPVVRGERYYLAITSPDAVPGDAVTLWYGDTVSATRAEVPLDISEEEKLLVDGEPVDGVLVHSLRQRSFLLFGALYWYAAAGAGLLLAGYCLYLCRMVRKGRDTALLRLFAAFRRYGYLLRQLVSRDFKAKYKRSVLGVLWSFLNPLLTMSVQYVVFSTLFRSDIPNFPLYLLTGIVCFNFFSEASGMALQSIVGNASLITKVYVPKYIYPVSRVLSSGVNLLLSLIPLFAVMLLTGTPVRPALLLLPFGLICLLGFCMGVGLILSTLMVFFRDTQFLWGVLSMLWMYATPIFYPESIIPARFLPLYKCNPLYHIIRFIRITLMDGVSPEPKAYALCLIASFVPLLAGVLVFKRHQDKFVLNL